MTHSQKAYFPALTGFRAVAAYMVFLHHANPFFASGWQKPLNYFARECYTGVTFFFVLSGFLIYYRYAETVKGTKNWFLSYIQNRVARLYPVWIILTTITFAGLLYQRQLLLNRETAIVYLSNITFLKGFFNDLKFSGISQGWSLTVEECFYLSAPLLFLSRSRMKFIFMPLVLFLCGCGLVWVFQSVNFFGFFADLRFMIIYTFFGRCFEFMAGAWLARYCLQRPPVSIQGQWRTYGGLVIVTLFIGLLAWLRGDASYGIDHPAGIVINNLFLPVGVALFIWGLITEDTWLRRLFSSSIFVLLGKSSYVFYLIHAGVFYAVAYRIFLGNVLLIFIAFNALAIMIYTFIEHPMNQRWKSSKI